MFRKLVSNLPFNPSLLGQVSFYAKRVKEEETLRRVGFGFVALAMFIQMFAVIAPPEKSLAYSSDYIINGLRNRDDILRAWDGKTSDANVAAIYTKLGLTRADIAALPYSPNVTLNSCWNDYWTMGRHSISRVSKASKIKQVYKNNEVPVNYGSGTVYLRQLKAWDIVNNCNTYRAFEGWKNGKQFWILVDCGNLTQVGKPPILKNPALQLRKTIVGGARAIKPGETFQFRFEYRNSVANSLPIENAVLTDNLDLKQFDLVNGAGGRLSGSTLTFNIGNIPYSSSYRTLGTITVRLKQNLNNGNKVCNAATLRASNAASVSSGGTGLCVTVNNPPVDVCPNIAGNQSAIPSGKIKDSKGNCVDTPKCPLDTSLAPTDSRCVAPKLTCSFSTADVNRSTKVFKMKTTVKSSNEYMTAVTGYVYDFGDDSAKVTKKSSSYTDEVSHTYEDGTYTANVIISYTAGRGSAKTNETVACSAPIESEPDQPLSQEKTARNLTQDLDEATTLTKKVKAGDIVEYTLLTHNTYDYDRNNVNVSDYIGDVLDYADLDMAYLTSQGGSYDAETKTISWKPQTAKANSELSNKFRVTMKTPIPSTNQPGSMTASFDCHISNKFGEQIDLEVDCPLPKSAEYITETLPNTGPGTSLIIGFTATTVVAYFFARSRLLAKELDIIRTDFAHTGGL